MDGSATRFAERAIPGDIVYQIRSRFGAEFLSEPRRQSPHQQACPDGVQEFEVERCRTVAASASFDDFAGEYSVQGGSVRNAVPAEARLEGELRSLLAAR